MGGTSRDEPSSAISKWTETLIPDPQIRKTATEWAVPVAALSLLAIGARRVYKVYLRRIPGSAYIAPSFFRRRSLFGRVTSVGDGDNFHMFHTPGGRWAGWGWLRRVPSTRPELKDRTIPIRLAGIDAPEGAHFGRPAQPFSAEALAWLTKYIHRRPIRAYIWKRDQYDRIVATVYTRRWLFFKRDVSLEMLRCGLATTYEAKTGVEFGGLEEQYRVAEARARSRRIGMWSGKPEFFESPRAYKTRHAAAAAAAEKEAGKDAAKDPAKDPAKETKK